MTNQQGAPEALYASAMEFAAEKASISYVQRKCRCSWNDAEQMLERMVREGIIATYNGQKSTALVEAQQPATHVQNPAGIEHVAGDVSKNGSEPNMAQQPAPSAAVALSDDLRDRLVAISEAVADQDDRAAQAMLREILKAPQPSPTPQADSQPAVVLDYPPLPSRYYVMGNKSVWSLEQMRAYVDADRAARAPAQVATNYKQALGSTNCMQCCVSYMLGVPMENVPDFANDGGWELFSEFVESKGYAAVMLPGNHEFEADYLASGTTARGTSHMVVMNDGNLVHDPHPSNAGLTEVQCVWLLAKKATPQRDDRGAFEACAKSYTSNVSFERDGNDYEDMTASLLWHGWKLRAARAPADSVTAPARPSKPLPYEPTSAMLIAAREQDPALPIETVRAIYWAMWRKAPTPPAQAADSVLEDAARLEQIAEAIRDYHHALDMRKHGGLAESAAFSSICNTMGMHWNRGEEAARRAARKQGGA